MEQKVRTRNKKSYYPAYVFVRLSQRQADTLKEVKAKTGLTDSDIVREALEQWLNATLQNLASQAVTK